MVGTPDRKLKLTRITEDDPNGDSYGGATPLIEVKARDRSTGLTHAASCINLIFSMEVMRDALAEREPNKESMTMYSNIIDEVETLVMANINAMLAQYKFGNTDIADQLVADYVANIIDGGKHIDEATARNTAAQVIGVVNQRLKVLIARAKEMGR